MPSPRQHAGCDPLDLTEFPIGNLVAGWCFPGDGCTGQVPIEINGFYTCETTCTMKNPVRVNEMDATLYDVTCKGEGGPADLDFRRMLFIRLQDEPGSLIEAPRNHFYPRSTASTRVLAISNNGVTELVRCEMAACTIEVMRADGTVTESEIEAARAILEGLERAERRRNK